VIPGFGPENQLHMPLLSAAETKGVGTAVAIGLIETKGDGTEFAADFDKG